MFLDITIQLADGNAPKLILNFGQNKSEANEWFWLLKYLIPKKGSNSKVPKWKQQVPVSPNSESCSFCFQNVLVPVGFYMEPRVSAVISASKQNGIQPILISNTLENPPNPEGNSDLVCFIHA